MKKNIKYENPNIEEYYKSNRIKWDQFYESERVVFSRLGLNPNSKVLDMGCGCAGLSLALKEKFGVKDYTGVEINDKAAQTAKSVNPNANIINADILEISSDKLAQNSFDTVFSLSCIDWNVLFDEMLLKGYSYVKPGGNFVSQFRLTDKETIKDINTSYQFINFNGKMEGEKAPYLVFNINDIIRILKKLSPDEIYGYGYWGNPRGTAVLPYDKLCFSVFTIKKSQGLFKDTKVTLDLPKDISEMIR